MFNGQKRVWVNFSELVDRIEINFSTWANLACERGLIKPSLYKHLKLTPPNLMQSTQFLTRVMWIVVRHCTLETLDVTDKQAVLDSAFGVDRIQDEVAKATGHQICDFYDNLKQEDIVQFLKNKPMMFCLEYSPQRKIDVVVALDYNIASAFRLKEVP